VQSSAATFRQNRWGRPVFLAALMLICVWTACSSSSCFVFADNDTPLRETARKLADRIVTIPGLHGPLRLEWHPDEKWPEGESARWVEMLRDAFDRRALQLSDDAAAPVLVVYAAETPTQVVLTAKTHIGERDEIRIITIPRSSLPPAELPVAPVRLERELLYENPDRILDATSFPDASDIGLAVLLYKNFEVTAIHVDAKGGIKQALPLNVAGLKPTRDPHADLTLHGTGGSVQLWGKQCDFSWESPGDVKCRPEKLNASSNSTSPDDAVLVSPCDETNWTITQPDSEPTVRAVLRLVPDGATQGSSATLTSEFPGPVLNINPEPNPSGALIVVRNLHTGNYEVYKITLACAD